MAHRTLVEGTAYEITGGRIITGGTAYQIAAGRTLVEGTGYGVSFGAALSSLPVGSSVYTYVNGVKREFRIVHQGRPSGLYDASCDGTWLLMKGLFTSRMWDSTNNSYGASDIHAYLNDTFLNMLDAGVRAQIRTARLPYVAGAGGNTVSSGSSGLSARIFLLSGYELGWTTSGVPFFPVDGACLQYFEGMGEADSGRVAALSGKVTGWWTRTPYGTSDEKTLCWCVSDTGGRTSGWTCAETRGIRPALIIDGGAKVDQDNMIMV